MQSSKLSPTTKPVAKATKMHEKTIEIAEKKIDEVTEFPKGKE
ncbi:MAG: hypothetical protein V4561_02705 [Bacteroidota bacterium]